MIMNKFENNFKIDLDGLNRLRNEFSSSYDAEELNHTAEIFKAIADHTRLQICIYSSLGICMLVNLRKY